MNDAPILSDDDPYSMPSMPTMHGGDPDALGRIDHYDLLRKLGGGGFGVVYLARDTASGVAVALKTLHPLIKRNAEEMDLLREKFALVSRLAHPNIATALVLHPVRDIHVWDDAARAELKLSPGDSVMVMRYAPGITLSRWRRQFPDGVVPPDLAFEIGRQVAAALDYAHGERIVHRDIKPGNIMVETLGGASRPGEPQSPDAAARRDASPHQIRVRILDFGLAAEIRSSMSRVSTEQGDTSGTRPYMAPEQWLGKKQDGRTDQYALACVLYELLSGAPPFAGVFETGDPMIMMATVKGEAPDEIEDASPAVNAALLRALAKAPKDRFPSCDAFVAALSSTTEHTEDTEGRDGNTPRPQRASGAARSPSAPQDSAALEADVLRRKVALARVLAAIPDEDHKDAGLSSILADAETELAAAEEAFKYSRIPAAAQCLTRAESEFARFRRAKAQLKEDEARTARLEAEYRRMEQEAKERTEREERARAASMEPSPGTVRTIEIAPRVTMNFCWCPATTSDAWKKISGGKDFFLMGSPPDEEGRSLDETQHPVRLTYGFWMGQTPVTQAQWFAVTGSNPSYHLDGKNWFGLGGKMSPRRPVDLVSWADCHAFLSKLQSLQKQHPIGFRFSLPTEAQWEYACRAGTTGPYSGNGKLIDMAWFFGNSNDGLLENETHDVALKSGNDWGFHDLYGNVWEWCEDSFRNLPTKAEQDPNYQGFPDDNRILRGGSFWSFPASCRSATRFKSHPGLPDKSFGFRLVAVPTEVSRLH